MSQSRFSSVFPTRNSKIAASVLIAALFCSTFFALYHPAPRATAYDEYMSLGLTVSPSGSSFNLAVNQTQTFTAKATNGTAPFAYSWMVSASGNFTLSVNGVETQVSNASALTVSGDYLTLLYPEATQEFVSVTASVKDSLSMSGSTWKPFVVADPYSSPGYKFDASTAPYSYMVETDGLGWYRAINGTDGSVVSSWSSTNSITLLQNVVNGLPTGGQIFVRGDNNTVYSGTGTLTIPGTVPISIVGEVEPSEISQTQALGIEIINTGAGDTIDVTGAGLTSTTQVSIKNLRITSTTGNALVMGTKTTIGLGRGAVLENLILTAGAAGKWCAVINNPTEGYMNNIFLENYDGLLLNNSDPTNNWGNMEIGFISVRGTCLSNGNQGPDGFGIGVAFNGTCVAGSSYGTLNLIRVGTIVSGTNSGHGTDLYLYHSSNIIFNYVDLEGGLV